MMRKETSVGRRVAVISTILFAVICVQAAPPGTGWSKVWYDEFNDYTVDSSKWNKLDIAGGANGWLYPSLATENGSKLVLENKSLTSPGPHGETIQGARIDSKQQWNRGYFETTCRLDWVDNHCWPTFWLWKWQSGATEATEFDIMEYTYHHTTPTQTHHFLNKTGRSERVSGVPVNSYHTWGLLWEADRVEFYIDGNPSFTSSNPSDPGTQTLPIILSTSPNNGNLPAPGANLPRFFVDGVRVWQGGTAPAPTGQRPYTGIRSIPGRIEAEHYDFGGEDIAYHDTTAGNSGGALRTDRVDIANRDGGQVVGWIGNGEWLEYTVNVTGGQYTLKARVACPASGKTIVVKVDGNTLRTINLPNTGSWYNYQDVSISGVWIGSKSDRVVRLEFPSGGFNLNWVELK